MANLTIDLEGRSNFHNVPTITLRYHEDQLGRGEDGKPIIILTPWQARRVEKHFCGIDECTCGSGPQFVHDYTIEGKEIWAVAVAAGS